MNFIIDTLWRIRIVVIRRMFWISFGVRYSRSLQAVSIFSSFRGVLMIEYYGLTGVAAKNKIVGRYLIDLFDHLYFVPARDGFAGFIVLNRVP